MRIALTVDPEIPVPPRYYGGIERVADMVARGLAARGHDVTLFAHAESNSAGRLVAWPGVASRSKWDTVCNTMTLARRVVRGDFDIVHSMSRLAYLLPLLPLRVPKLMTYHRHVSRRSVRLGTAWSRGSLWFSGVSRRLVRNVCDVGVWRIVYDGVPLATHAFSPDPGPDAPLLFLGRVEEIKGPHLAIELAQRTGIPLVLAGHVSPEHRAFFEAKVSPHIDGSLITYVGPVDEEQKNALLARARAFLMPILWEEPSGLIVPEAMACGTPVVGLARGGVPEYVEDGVTGYLADDVDGMVEGLRKIDTISRRACRERVERLFSDRAIVEAYERVYLEMIDAARGAAVH